MTHEGLPQVPPPQPAVNPPYPQPPQGQYPPAGPVPQYSQHPPTGPMPQQPYPAPGRPPTGPMPQRPYPAPGQPTGPTPQQGQTGPLPGQSPQHSPPNAPTSGPQTAPTPVSGPPGNGYLLGVDLGTSHTVAVIRWPDGRSRPLLVDGAPVMPSAVFCDESGHVHVGRDAQRLAQTDPTRFEPNPKHRIDEPTILLGDREVPITALLSAVLREVAAKAVESVGHLPPAVLTCPAKWGPRRRSILEDAAAQAGFPPVKLVPEPVAAAHYFAEVMRQPIPVGKSLAVFDFGGGTLDVAVVRHEPDGGFSLQADGGLEDLGGLDVDAALVEYMGRTISGTVPDVWQQLSQPQSGSDRRNRRLFWDDVRGAKEMLSRTTVAPVPVPGVDSSLHMTREELEKLAGPLLGRAVAETQRVIAASGQRPEELAGLFLVGGASRIPLVSRLLHSELGIAPTVLEQPELPVAEGSVPAAFGGNNSEPVTAQPVSPVTGPYTPPPPGQTPPEGFLEPAPPPKPWYKRKLNWIAAAVVLVLLVGLGWWFLHDPYPQRDMHGLEQVGSLTAVPGDGSAGQSDIDRDVAYFPSSTENYVTAVDLNSGKKKWATKLDSNWTSASVRAENGIVYAANPVNDETPQLAFLDADSGHLGKTVDLTKSDSYGDSPDREYVVGDRLVRVTPDEVIGYDAKGNEKWKKKIPGGKADGSDKVLGWDNYTEPRNGGEEDYDGRFWVHTDGGTVTVFNADDGSQEASKHVGDGGAFLAYEGMMYVASGDSGYTITSYDIDNGLEQGSTLKPSQSKGKASDVVVCGEEILCVKDNATDTDTWNHVTVIRVGSKPSTLWSTRNGSNVVDVFVAGETIDIETTKSDTYYTQLYQPEGETIGARQKGDYYPVDSGSFVTIPGLNSTSASVQTTKITGLGAEDGKKYSLGDQEVGYCEANDTHLACDVSGGYRVWKFRD